MGEVKVGDGSFGPVSKEKLGEAVGVDENINEEILERKEQPESSHEHSSSMLKQPEEDL